MFYPALMPLPPPDPFLRLRARGADTNMSGRFEPYAREPASDGWDIPEDDRLLRTEVAEERPRSVITRNTSPDIPFDRSLNPYRGCEHGCIYCFARPTHAYLGLSPGLDFETRLTAKPDAPQVLERELGKKGYVPDVLAIGTNTDPYQPIEARWRIMRRVLQVLSDWNHPVAIVTKGAMIERDLDILSDMARRNLVSVGISVTSLDPSLSRKLEPRAPTPARRLAAIRALAQAGVPVRAMVAPVIPVVTDREMEAILAATAEAGARTASWILLRLPLEVAPLFRDWLERHEPLKAAHVMNRLREMRGGKDYDAEWGKRMKGEGLMAELIGKRFRLATKRLGLDGKIPPLDLTQFCRPARAGGQLSLF
jgi:DNA repair photolyase